MEAHLALSPGLRQLQGFHMDISLNPSCNPTKADGIITNTAPGKTVKLRQVK